MKILWVKSDFLHPPNRGGRIRSFEMLRQIRRRHDVHYVAFSPAAGDPAVEQAPEYCTSAEAIPFAVPARGEPAFLAQAVRNLISPLPLPIERYRSAEMRRRLGALIDGGGFDSIVCDFLTPAVNFPKLDRAIVFQHNVETMIWERHAQTATSPVSRRYYRSQSARMERFERDACRAARAVIAVSAADEQVFRNRFGLSRTAFVPTGVDAAHFQPPTPIEPEFDLIFLGAMDWMPNIEGIGWFLARCWDSLRERFPELSLAVVGRSPVPAVQRLAELPGITVTGTVPDVREYLWKSRLAIVPLNVGGGTRLKIYEYMAAGIPVISTTVGAEGLDAVPGEHIVIADDPTAFVEAVASLLEDAPRRERLAGNAQRLVRERFSWDSVARRFESLLEQFR